MPKLLIDPLEARLNPPSPSLSPADHQLAHARDAIDELFSQLYVLSAYILAPTEGGEAHAKQLAEHALTLMDTATSEAPWEAVSPDFEQVTKGLTQMHQGDCTGTPATCVRCYAEGRYALPSSVSWKNKSEGAKVLAQYVILKNKTQESS
jgi:hypothetical protein